MTNFLYLFFFDFRKINGRNKIFEKYTFGVILYGGKFPPAAPHGVKSLPPWGTAAG
jgi:hypothetical protein